MDMARKVTAHSRRAFGMVMITILCVCCSFSVDLAGILMYEKCTNTECHRHSKKYLYIFF